MGEYYDFEATSSTMYDSEVFSYTLPQLAGAFANYAEILKSMKTIGEDFFGNSEGAIFSESVGNKLWDTWDKKVCSDFDEFEANFDSWIADANAEGLILENFHGDVARAYDRLTKDLDTGATASSNGASSLLGTPEVPLTQREISEQTGITELEVNTSKTILGANFSLSPAEWSMIRGVYNSGQGPRPEWPEAYRKVYESVCSGAIDIEKMQEALHAIGENGSAAGMGFMSGGGMAEQLQQNMADKPADGFDDDNTK